MIFAAPAVLWALPLASAPLLWHLFMKPRRRAVAFPSLMFFLRAEPRLEGRRKLREWLILALRCLLIALVVAAIARPRLPAVGGGGSAALALVVDTSASMAAPGADGRPLARLATETAAALVNAVGAGGRAVVVPTAPDPAVALPARPSADRAALGAAIDRLGPTEAAGDPAAALAHAIAALADDEAADREIRIISDLQAGEWDRAARLPPLPTGVRVTVHPLVPRAGGGGVDIARVLPPPGRSVAGRPARCLVELANRTAAAAPATLRIATADGEDQREVQVPVGGTVAVPVLLHPAEPGAAWAMLRLEGNAVGAAARAGCAAWAHDRIAALLCGDPVSFGPLGLALAPDGSGAISGIVPQTVAPAGLAAALAKARPGLVATTWEQLPGIDAVVRPWVEGGGTLLVLPGLESAAPPAGTPAWTGIRPDAGVRATTPLATVLPDPGAACWEHVRDAAGAVEVRLRVSRAWPLGADPGSRTALALADGRALIAERRVGSGLVVASGLAFHPGWSDLPLKGWSLALVQGLALRVAPAGRTLDLVAGQGLPPAPGDRTAVRLRAIAGGPLDWSGPRDEAPAPVRAGVYQLESAGSAQPPLVVAVRAAPDEGIQRYAEGARAQLLAGLDARVVAVRDAADAAADWRTARRGVDLAAWLVALALLCWLAEGWLASGAGGPRGTP